MLIYVPVNRNVMRDVNLSGNLHQETHVEYIHTPIVIILINLQVKMQIFLLGRGDSFFIWKKIFLKFLIKIKSPKDNLFKRQQKISV